MMSFTRRDFIAVAGSGVAAVANATHANLLTAVSADAGHPQLANSDDTKHDAESFVPDQVLELKSKIIVLDGTKVKVRAYNEQIPGPLFKVKGGDTLNIRVVNSLPPFDSSVWGRDMNVPHNFGHTNLHLHGLNIAPHLFEPLGTTEVTAPMISIAPGEYKDFSFFIPTDQPPGLKWYHPHGHGSTAIQAVSGLAGGIIVIGAIDDVPEIKAAKDYCLVLQDIGLFETNDPHADYSDSYEPQQNAIWDTFASDTSKSVTVNGQPSEPPQKCGFTTGDYHLRYYLVNGQPYFKEEHNFAKPTEPLPTQLASPTYKLRPGEVARFRVLNACSDLMMPIQVEEHVMVMLAMDGNNFENPSHVPYELKKPQVILGPANRVEFLIKATDKPGRYRIFQLEQASQFLKAAQKSIAIIEVEGQPVDMAIPHALPPNPRYPPIKDDEVVRRRDFIFSSRFPGTENRVVGIDFLINNQLYDEFAVPTTVFLDECEEWHIIVPDSARGGSEGHPFHIHVNDFEIESVAGVKPTHRLVQDTIWVAQNTEAVIRIRFKQWVGKSVFHCHILPHEDTGMMQNFLILEKRPQHHHERAIVLLQRSS
jgi:suppressor of ftsI